MSAQPLAGAFLSDPLLLRPRAGGVDVVWFTSTPGRNHAVVLADGRTIPADTLTLTRMDEPVFRHVGHVDGIAGRIGYHVVSDGQASGRFSLAPAPEPGSPVRLLLTSDHQAKPNTAANIELAVATVGPLDGVIMPGDLVNDPDRASDWFGPSAGSVENRAFLPVVQGRARALDTGGHRRHGAALVQSTPLLPAIGNHEVAGRFGPSSCSTTSYRQVTGMPPWYALTVGDVHLITLFCARMWRGVEADPDPAARMASSRYQEARSVLDTPEHQGGGCFLHEPIGPGSTQWDWLVAELDSPQRRAARYTVVQLHEGPHGLGENLTPPFREPRRIEEREDGRLVGVRYEYDAGRNLLLDDLAPLLEDAGVQLVVNGHSHLWNRFVGRNGRTHWVEGSNTGNTYGAYTRDNGQLRHVPPAPWRSELYPARDDPDGLEPQVPNVAPLLDDAGRPLPYVASNDHVVFQVLDSGTGDLTSWIADVRDEHPVAHVLDRVSLTAQ